MPIATVSIKGQITLPARFRRKLGLGPQGRVTIEAEGDAIVVRAAADFFELEGFLGKALSPEKEKAGMMRGASTRTGDRTS